MMRVQSIIFKTSLKSLFLISETNGFETLANPRIPQFHFPRQCQLK